MNEYEERMEFNKRKLLVSIPDKYKLYAQIYWDKQQALRLSDGGYDYSDSLNYANERLENIIKNNSWDDMLIFVVDSLVKLNNGPTQNRTGDYAV